MKHKKASMFDVMLYAIVIFALALIILFGDKLMNTFNTEIQANPDLSATSKTIMSDSQSRYAGLFDGIWLTVFILLAVIIAVGAYFIYNHPVFFVPALLISLFVIMLSGILVNVFSDVSSSSDLSAERADFSLIPFVMGNDDNPKGYFLPFMVIFTFLVIIVSYAKLRSEA